jgi:hypothetical protein
MRSAPRIHRRVLWSIPFVAAILAATLLLTANDASADHAYGPANENHWGHHYQPKVAAPVQWTWAYTSEAEWSWTNAGSGYGFGGFCVGGCAAGAGPCDGNNQGGFLKVCIVNYQDAPLYQFRYGFTRLDYRTTDFVTGERHIDSAYIWACGNCQLPDDFYHSIINHEYGHALVGGRHSSCCGLQLMSGGQWTGWYVRFQSWHDIADLQWTYNHQETN